MLTSADRLDSVLFVVGILAVLRSKSQNGQVIGVMVTASHNPECDNGVKLVEPMGEMLDQRWEVYATGLANADTTTDLISKVEEIVQICRIDMSKSASVIVGRDTRPSGASLVQALIDGVMCVGGSIENYGVLTTPQLHYITRCLNTRNTPKFYGVPDREGYFKKLSDAYTLLTAEKENLCPLRVDCANGVGAIALKELIKVIGPDRIEIIISHDDTVSTGVLNEDCGADYVKMNQKSPRGTLLSPDKLYCSLDGDADRIVFYYADGSRKFKLLDGDKIATLVAGFIMSKIKEADICHADNSILEVGLVQTAYANGNSTKFARDILQIPVVFTSTGVKHLHHAAAEFDVGVYFEANGHGTVLFSDKMVEVLCSFKPTSEKSAAALQTLKSLINLINQTVGDALSDMLLVLVILACSEQTHDQWDSSYTDLPSHQEKVNISDRTMFVSYDADTELLAPAHLQTQINKLVKQFKDARCFVRPSGTEDVVRVYTEAATATDTETLSNTICGLVYDLYGGIGDRPAKFIKAKQQYKMDEHAQ